MDLIFTEDKLTFFLWDYTVCIWPRCAVGSLLILKQRAKKRGGAREWVALVTSELSLVMANADTFLSDVHVGTLSPISGQVRCSQ